MDVPVEGDVLLFDGFRFDRRGGGLFRQDDAGALTPVAIGGRALDVLAILIRTPGALVAKDVIMNGAWPGRVVEESNLTVQISALRRVLEEGRPGEDCIQTVPGRGYRFVRPVTRCEAPPPGAPAPPEAAPGALAEPPAAPSRPRGRWAAAALAAGVLAVLATGGWWLRQPAVPAPVPGVAAPPPLRPAAYSPQDRRQSVIIVPFENSSDDPGQDGLAAGITRDLTDKIAASPEYPLVPAAAAAAYRGRPLDLRAIGRAHDVHFVLTGSARRQDGRLIVSATLFDTAAQRSLWSQRYDRPDTSESWLAVIWGIHWNFGMATRGAEAERANREHPESLDKRDLMNAARSAPVWQISEAAQHAQLALVARALALDPDYFWAIKTEASLRVGLVLDGFSDDRAGDLARATRFVDRALLLRPNDPDALRTKASIFRAEGDLPKAEALMRRVVELDPMVGHRYRDLGLTLLDQGKYAEALESFLTAKRIVVATGLGAFASGVSVLSRIDASLAAGFLMSERHPEAVVHARLSIAGFPDSGRAAEWAWLVLIAAEGLNGEQAAARADLRTYLATPRALRSMTEIGKRAGLARLAPLLAGLRLAGMPEE